MMINDRKYLSIGENILGREIFLTCCLIIVSVLKTNPGLTDQTTQMGQEHKLNLGVAQYPLLSSASHKSTVCSLH